MKRTLVCLALVAGATLLPPGIAQAAESYDNCSGFITSLPATITTQGVWCFDRDLSTAIASGSAITVATNNVIIDCNHFKMGGLQAGLGTATDGIVSTSRLNTTIRNCNIRGFRNGVLTTSGGGHLVEGNRFDGNTSRGISVSSPGSMIRNNQIMDTGGSTSAMTFATGLSASQGVDVIDNTINGVAPAGANAIANGIFVATNGEGSVTGNRVRGMVLAGTGNIRGIYHSESGRIVIRDNTVQGPGSTGSTGIRCQDDQGTAANNVVAGFETAIMGCLSDGNTINAN